MGPPSYFEPVKQTPSRYFEAHSSSSLISVHEPLGQAGEQGAHGNVIVVVEVDDIAEVVVLVPARAAAMAGPLVRPEAVVSCTQAELLQQQIMMMMKALAS